MHRTFRYRLYPTRQQTETLSTHLREASRLYNAALQERRDAWKMQRRSISFYDQDAQLKLIRADGNLAIANYDASRDVLRRVALAFDAFFARVKRGEKPGYPRFKASRRYDSITYRTPEHGCRLRDDGKLYLQGVGNIKVKLHRPVDGTTKNVTIKREAGMWYALIICEVKAILLPSSTDVTGIDVGLTTFATLSDGTEIANPRYERKAQAKVRIAQRRVSRRKKGSNGRSKAVRLLRRARTHVANQRADFHHKTARALVNQYGLIAVEDLNIKGLAGSVLARSVNDAGWGLFINTLTSKAESAGRVVVKVNPRNTTQACSGCGCIVPKNLSQRWHNCPDCGLSVGRDLNAARNILGLGLSLVALTWPAGACVAAEAITQVDGVVTHPAPAETEEQP